MPLGPVATAASLVASAVFTVVTAVFARALMAAEAAFEEVSTEVEAASVVVAAGDGDPISGSSMILSCLAI
jgi:hypothetical protein